MVGLQRTHAYFDPRGRKYQQVIHRDRARVDRAGHHGASPSDGEAAIDGEAKVTRGGGAHGLSCAVSEMTGQFSDTGAGARRYRQTGRLAQPGRREQRSNLRLHFGQAGRVDEIGFGQDDRTAGDAKQIEDAQVLARLRHDTVVSGDHQEHKVDAGCACEHVVDEALVSRHIDKRQLAVGRVGVAQIEGDAPRFFFGQSVGIDAREGLD